MKKINLLETEITAPVASATTEEFVIPYADVLPAGTYDGEIVRVEETSCVIKGVETLAIDIFEILTDSQGNVYRIRFRYFKEYDGIEKLKNSLAFGGFRGKLRDLEGESEKVTITHFGRYANVASRAHVSHKPPAEESIAEDEDESSVKNYEEDKSSHKAHDGRFLRSRKKALEEERRKKLLNNDEEDENEEFDDFLEDDEY